MATETENPSLERTELDEPDLPRIINELQQSATDIGTYLGRVAMSQSWWQCEWDGMYADGKVRIDNQGRAWPWEGASDSRLHIVQTIVQEHVTLDLVAFWSARVQCKSIRPFVHGRDANIADKMLQWRVYTHMKRELLRELPLAFTWKHAMGLAFLGIEWEQEREIVEVPITLDMIDQITSQLGLSALKYQILDPDKAYDDQLIPILQAMSPVMTTAEARGILNDLRNTGNAQVPTVQLRINKPVWTARRPGIDTLIPSETVDVQRSRWVANRELVSETELEDRIETDGYDPDFVTEAISKKGLFASFTPRTSNNAEPSMGSHRDMIELYHFYMRYLHNGVTCLYRTVFCDSARHGADNLYALHRKSEYDHGQYPIIALRRVFHFRPLLSSIGIADEAYTDEMDIKRQQDGLNNRTDLIHKPPMIVPTLRAQATKNAYGPNAVMTALRPNEVTWAPLPPMDQTPILVMQQVEMRLDRRYAIIGGAVDPEIKAVRRQQLAQHCLGEIELALEMTFQLEQQYETDADVQRVAGGKQPWKRSVTDIQGQHEVTASIDMKMIDIEQAKAKMSLLAEMLPFKQAGGVVFQAAAQIIDPDLADALMEDQMSPTAMEREKSDEYNAMAQIMAGIEPEKPLTANAQFRMQVMNQIVQQPQVTQKLMADPVAQKLFQNRLQFFQNQIQQFQMNPQIGRTLATQTFQPSQPAAVTQGPAQ